MRLPPRHARPRHPWSRSATLLKGKPVALGFSKKMTCDDYKELWLCRMTAAKVYWGTLEEVWQEVARDWVAPWTRGYATRDRR